MEMIITLAGVVHTIYGEDIPLEALGPMSITRASVVEPDAGGEWHVDLAPVGGPKLGPYSRRSNALTAEVDWLRRHWLRSFPAHKCAGRKGGPMKAFLRTPAVRLLILCTCLTPLIACDENATPAKDQHQADAQRQAELQAQLLAEQSQRRQAEAAVALAEQSRTTWIFGVGAGACLACVFVGMAGIYIGSRALRRGAKESKDG